MQKPTRALSHPDKIMNPIESWKKGSCLKKCGYHWVRFMAVLSPIVWLSLLLAFQFVVQDHILSVPGEEWELTAQVRDTITGSETYENIGTVADIFDWLEQDVIPTLVPKSSDVQMRNAHAHFIRTAPGFQDTPVNTINGILSLVEDKILIRQVRTTSMSHGQKNDIYGKRIESNLCTDATSCPDHFSHIYTAFSEMPPACSHIVDNKVDLSYVASSISMNTGSVMASGRSYSGNGFVEVIDGGLYTNTNINANANGNTEYLMKTMKPPHAEHNSTREPITNKTYGEINLKSVFVQYDKSLAQTHQCALAKIRGIKNSGWVDELTRAIFVEYCVSPYWSVIPHKVNRNMSATRRWERKSDEFCEYQTVHDDKTLIYSHTGSGVCHLQESVGACHRVVFEHNRYGRVTSTQAVMTSRADSEPGDLEQKGWLLQIVGITGLVLTCIIEITELLYSLTSKERQAAYMKPSSLFWNLLTFITILGLIMTLVHFPFHHQPFSPASLQYNAHQDEGKGWQPIYTQFDVLEQLEQTRFWFAITSLFWWMKGIEYFGVFPALQLPVIAIWYSMSTVVSFFAFFGMLLVGASMCFRFLFGTSSNAFSDITSSIMSMLLASIGEFRTEEVMVDYRKSNAEFWMLMWAIVMSFIVLTMFVAIIDQGYQDAKASLEEHPITGGLVLVRFINGHVASEMLEENGKKKSKKKIKQYFQGKIIQVNIDGTFDIAFRNDVSETSGLAKTWNPTEEEWDISKNEDDWAKVIKRGVMQSALVFIPKRENGSILTLLLTQWVDKLFHYTAIAKKTAKEVRNSIVHITETGKDVTKAGAVNEKTKTAEVKKSEGKFFDTSKVVPIKGDKEV